MSKQKNAPKTYAIVAYMPGSRWYIVSGLSSRDAADRALIAVASNPSMTHPPAGCHGAQSLHIEVES